MAHIRKGRVPKGITRREQAYYEKRGYLVKTGSDFTKLLIENRDTPGKILVVASDGPHVDARGYVEQEAHVSFAALADGEAPFVVGLTGHFTGRPCSERERKRFMRWAVATLR